MESKCLKRLSFSDLFVIFNLLHFAERQSNVFVWNSSARTWWWSGMYCLNEMILSTNVLCSELCS